MMKQASTMMASVEEEQPGLIQPDASVDKQLSLIAKALERIESNGDAQAVLKYFRPVWTPS
jgi:PBP1b-binding outer membrane lipoprotein LpoB